MIASYSRTTVPAFSLLPVAPAERATSHGLTVPKPSMHERRNEQSRSRFISDRFGIRLRQLRASRNLSQTDMAVSFGIDRSFISDVERGRKSVGLPMLEVIALGFGMTLAELLEDL
jgi:ribosome-binding protein aMBF1 (putative translation factor)